jgi:hypothetical protein
METLGILFTAAHRVQQKIPIHIPSERGQLWMSAHMRWMEAYQVQAHHSACDLSNDKIAFLSEKYDDRVIVVWTPRGGGQLVSHNAPSGHSSTSPGIEGCRCVRDGMLVLDACQSHTAIMSSNTRVASMKHGQEKCPRPLCPNE